MAAEPLYLTIMKQGDTVTMDLSEVSPVVPRSQIRIQADLLLEVGKELSRITELANKAMGSHHVGAAQASHSNLQQLGEQLFMQLFPAPTRQRLKEAAPGDLFLRLDDQLVHIPWELAFDGHDFLLNRFCIGRQVITHQRPAVADPHGRPDPDILKILIVVDPTESLDAAADEADYLCELLDACDNVAVEILSGKQLRKLELLQALSTCDLVHYAGHAFFDAEHPERSGWILHNAVLTAPELSRVARPPQLVFSNACHAGATSRWTSDAVYEDQAFGIGSAFLLAGAQNYIGTFCVIHDTHSATFAATFYQHLLQGRAVGSSLAAARRQARQHEDEYGLLWASYMHSGNPMFEFLTEGEHEAAVPDAAATAPLPQVPVGEVDSRAPNQVSEREEPVGRGAAALHAGRTARTESPHAEPHTLFWKRPWLITGVLLVLGMILAFVLSKSGQLRPDGLGIVRRAHQLLAQGDIEQAETHFQRLTQKPGARLRGEAYAGLAAIALAKGAYEEGLSLAEKADDHDSELSSSHVIRGHILWRQGQVKEAAGAYRTALQKAHSLPSHLAMANNRLGLAAAAEDRPEAALTHYRQALEAHTDPAAVRVHQGYLLEKLGRTDEALALYREALEINPADPLAAVLLREAERRQDVARNTEKQKRIDAQVQAILQAHRERQPRAEADVDPWTSRPLTLALLEIEDHSRTSGRAGEAEALGLELLWHLQHVARIRVVEREVLEAILAELKLGTSELADAQTAFRIGKLDAARLLVTGALRRSGAQGQFSVRVLETETTRIKATELAEVETPDTIKAAVGQVAASLMQTLRQAYPLRGRLAQVDAQEVILNIGAEHGVEPGVTLQIYPGDDVSFGEAAGLVEVTSVSSQRSRARVLEQTADLQPQWKAQEVHVQ